MTPLGAVEMPAQPPPAHDGNGHGLNSPDLLAQSPAVTVPGSGGFRLSSGGQFEGSNVAEPDALSPEHIYEDQDPSYNARAIGGCTDSQRVLTEAIRVASSRRDCRQLSTTSKTVSAA